MNSLISSIEKEWSEHRGNHIRGEWYECQKTESQSWRYAVGATISNGSKTIILKTQKEADEYTAKEQKKFSYCDVCERFKRILKEAKK